jgi:hypothetical protein
MILKINHWLFAWYYKRVPEHFQQWTLLKSVRLLIENYIHLKRLYDMEMRNLSAALKESNQLRNQLNEAIDELHDHRQL